MSSLWKFALAFFVLFGASRLSFFLPKDIPDALRIVVSGARKGRTGDCRKNGVIS